MELDSRKKSRRDRMICSKSFEMQEVREIGRKEAGESRDFSVLWLGIIEDVKDLKCEDENPCQRKEGDLAWDRQLCLGHW